MDGDKCCHVNVDVALVTCPKIKIIAMVVLQQGAKRQTAFLCCRNVLISETLSLGCVDNNRRVLYAVGAVCALAVFSPLLQFHISAVHTHPASGFRSRTLLTADQPNAVKSIQVNKGSRVNVSMIFVRVLNFTRDSHAMCVSSLMNLHMSLMLIC